MRALWFGALGLVGVLLMMALPARVIRHDWTVSQLAWNDEQALLVLGSRRVGWITSAATYGLYALLNVLWVAPPSSEVHDDLTIIRITRAGEETFIYRDTQPMMYWPFEGTIAGVFHGELAKLNGGHWDALSSEERREFEGRERPGADYDNKDGWSGRCCVVSRGDSITRFDIDLRSASLVLVVTRDDDRRHTKIVLEREHEMPREVWSIDWYPHRVSRADYDSFVAH